MLPWSVMNNDFPRPRVLLCRSSCLNHSIYWSTRFISYLCKFLTPKFHSLCSALSHASRIWLMWMVCLKLSCLLVPISGCYFTVCMLGAEWWLSWNLCSRTSPSVFCFNVQALHLCFPRRNMSSRLSPRFKICIPSFLLIISILVFP